MEPRDIVDMLIYIIVAVGLVWAAIRLYQDYSLRNETLPSESDE